MILEHAVLDVKPGQEAEFEAAFATAQDIIAAAEGFGALRLERCVETTGRYLLLVEWASVAAHVEGFRGSEAFERWRALLHHFYSPAPTVEHFSTIATR
jgi:heme-degrading monooxygenase HmoA